MSPSLWRRSSAALALSAGLLAQAPVAIAEEPAPIDAAQREAVLDQLQTQLIERYVFPEMGQDLAKHVKKQARKGAYKELTDGPALAEKLTADLQELSKDKHLRVLYSEEPIVREAPREPSAEEREARLARSRFFNHGFEKVERLEGNIGYLEMRGFTDPSVGGETAHAAMTFLSNSEAIIIDLRRNGGGSPEMIQLISSYLFEGDPVHLNDLYWRDGDVTQQFWTLPHVPGPQSGDVDVYVLTSGRTFSAAEEFSYNLQALERATIVGETTGGGAHPGGTVPLDEHFLVWVPQGRAINPITGTNWEGTGVTPDIEVEKDKALETAWLMALEKRIETEEHPGVKELLEKKAGELRTSLSEGKGE